MSGTTDGTTGIRTVSRPGKPDMEFRQCPMWMVAPGDTIIVPICRTSAGGEVFGHVGSAQTEGNTIFSYTRLAVRALTEAGFEIMSLEDDASRARLWVLVP